MSYITCACCKKQFEKHRIVQCSICAKDFNIDCVDITASEARKIHSKTGLSWHCNGCVSLGNDINSLKSIIVKLQDDIMDLKKICKVPNAQPSILDTEVIIQEVHERQKRASNFIIYSSSENVGDNKNTQVIADKELAKSILTDIGISESVVQTFRLGKFDPTNKQLSRPIKVILNTPEAVSTVLRNAKKLKSIPRWSKLSISPDRTKMQTDLYKSIKEELKRRESSGESNLIIRYKNGIPTIVKQEN